MFVVPKLLSDQIKKKNYREAMTMVCRIIGIVIIVKAIISYII